MQATLPTFTKVTSGGTFNTPCWSNIKIRCRFSKLKSYYLVKLTNLMLPALEKTIRNAQKLYLKF